VRSRTRWPSPYAGPEGAPRRALLGSPAVTTPMVVMVVPRTESVGSAVESRSAVEPIRAVSMVVMVPVSVSRPVAVPERLCARGGHNEPRHRGKG
jgi:hypothetical protein